MKNLAGAAALFVVGIASIPVGVSAGDAHVHGRATLNAVVDAGRVLIELDSPAMNLVGFEYRPASSEDRAALGAALSRLRDGASLYRFPGPAACRLQSVDVLRDHEVLVLH